MENPSILRQFFRAVFHELFRSKNAYNAIASVALLSIVALGYAWQERYISTATIAIGESSFGGDGGGNTAQLKSMTRFLRSRNFQEQAVNSLSNNAEFQGLDRESQIQKFITSTHSQVSGNILELNYASGSPANAQNAMRYIVAQLIEASLPAERIEQLQHQTQQAKEDESRLEAAVKEKETLWLDLRSSAGVIDNTRASNRILNLRESIQDIEININTVNAKIDRIQKRLAEEQSLQTTKTEIKSLEERQAELQKQIEENKTLYIASDPQIVSLQNEVDNIQVELVELRNQALIVEDENTEDSLYNQLRKQLSENEVEKAALVSRYDSLRALLKRAAETASSGQTASLEMEKRQREFEQAKQELAQVENTRKALDDELFALEKSKPNFVILDEPNAPQTYTGMGFVEFLILGPIVAFGLPIFVASLLVLSDSRIRTSRQLDKCVPSSVAVLGVIPHYNSPKTLRVFRKAILGLVTWGAFVVIVYITLGVIGLKG